MGVVGPRVLDHLTESKVKAAKIQIESFASALDLYFLDTGRYPNEFRGPRGPGAAAGQHARPGTAPISGARSFPPIRGATRYVYRSPGQARAL